MLNIEYRAAVAFEEEDGSQVFLMMMLGTLLLVMSLFLFVISLKDGAL